MFAPGSVGIGWRPEIAHDLLRARGAVDLVEVVAEACFAQSLALREAQAVAEVWSVVLHGVKLSLGSAGGVDVERARRLGALARALRVPAISEHVAFVRAGDREIGHLTPLPFTRQAVDVVRRNVVLTRRSLPDVPLLLENVAWTFRWPDDELSEGDFYGEVVRETGCELLLDLGNVYANARNAGVNPMDLLMSYPLEHVGMIHIAGGTLEGDFYFDTHAHEVPATVYEMLEHTVGRAGPVPVILERDARFPAFDALAAEIARARGCVERARAPETIERALTQKPARTLPKASEAADLATKQVELARLLIPDPGDDPFAPSPFDAEAIARSRAVLQHKRVDDALPLVPNLTAKDRARTTSLAEQAIAAAPRASRHAAAHDAWRIVTLAREVPGLVEEAKVDALALRARFRPTASGPERLTLRRSPFLGREVARGRIFWVWKGFGAAARVVSIERGAER